MVTVTIALEDEWAERLQNFTKHAKLTQEEVIKLAIQQYIKPKPVKDPLIGLFDFGDPDLAEKSEEILLAGIKPHSGWSNKP